MKEFVEGFNVLHGTRQMGMGMNPITLTEMLAYLEIYGSDDPHTFIKYILAMDDAYIDASVKKAEREKEIEKRKAASGK